MFVGIWNNFADTDILNIIYNSIFIGGSAASGTYSTYGFLRGGDDGTSITTPNQIFNNIFYNERQGSGNHFAIGNQVTTVNWTNTSPCSSDFSPNHNAFYTSNLANTGSWLGSANSFSNWQTSSGADIKSIALKTTLPLGFTNKAIADLHLPATGNKIDADALPLPLITLTDFDGIDFRRGPDIGADEVQNIVSFTHTNSDAWNDPGNWDANAIPDCADFVIIPAGKSTTVYQNVGNALPVNDYRAVFYTLDVQGTLTVNNGSTMESCWLYDGAGNIGEFKNNGSFIVQNNGKLNLAGRFTNNSTFTKGFGLTQLNVDKLETADPCIRDFILPYNQTSPISDINGSSNTNYYNLNLLNNSNTTIISVHDVDVGDMATKVGYLDIQGTGFLSLNDNKLTLHGTLIEDTGTLTGSLNAKLYFLGQGDLVGTVKLTPLFNFFREVFMNRTSSGLVTLGNSDIKINTLLTLNNGLIKTNAFEVNVTSALPTSVINNNSLSYIFGNLRRSVSGVNNYDFPVGDASRYENINVSITSAFGLTSNILGFFNPTNASWNNATSFSEASINYDQPCTGGYWTLTPDFQPSSGAYDITLFPVGMVCGGPRPTFAKRTNSAANWIFGGSTYINQDKRTGFTSFSEFSKIGSTVPLPVTIINFQASLRSDNVIITWTTSFEQSSSHFIVQRSIDGVSFTDIGKVLAKGNSASLQHYSLTDPNTPEGATYYRLKEVDYNESMKLSKTISLNEVDKSKITVFPNPSNGDNLTISSDEAIRHISIMSVYGIQIKDINVTESINLVSFKLDHGFPAGEYILAIKTLNNIVYKKIMIIK